MKHSSRLRGCILPGFLLLTLLIAGASIGAYLFVIKTVRIQGAELRSLRLRNETLAEVLEPGRAGTREKNGLCCSSSRGKSGYFNSERRLCAVCAAAPLSHAQVVTGEDPGFPLFNGNLIFENADACEISQNTPVPVQLSPSAIRSAAACVLQGAGLAAPRSFRANLWAEDLALGDAAVNQAVLLAASGYIIHKGTLRLKGPAVIFAGGDLLIDSIVTESESPPDLTLVSATGVVSVKEIAGTAAVKGVGRLGVFAAGALRSQAVGLMPPLISMSPIFLSQPNRD